MNSWSDFLLMMIMWVAGIVTGWTFGSTPPSTPHRTEAKVIYDSGTGCQYLSSHSGRLIPRLDAKGRQVCRHE